MAVRVVRAMLIMTLHLFFDSLFIIVWRFAVYVAVFNLVVDVIINAEDGAAVDKNLGEDVEDAVVDFAGRWKHEGDECHDDTTGEKDDSCPLFEFGFHKRGWLRLEANPT